jgi:hypothetical protein
MSMKNLLTFSWLRLSLVSLFVACILLTSTTAVAQTNPQINYQAKLTTSSGVAVPNGTYNLRFWLVSSPSIATSSALWTESLTGSQRVQVTNGLFSVMLGSSTPLTSVDFNQPLYLAVEVGGTSTSPTWDGEMSPRKILGTVPAAFEARRLEGLSSSSLLRSDEADTMAATSSNTILTVIQGGAGAIARFFSGVTEVFTIGANGNVGVGTSSPIATFAVNGTGYFSSSTPELLTIERAGSANAVIRARNSLGSTYFGIANTTGDFGIDFDNDISATPALTVTRVNEFLGLGTTSPSARLTIAGDMRLTGRFADASSSTGSVGNVLLATALGTAWTATSSLGLGNGTFLGLTDTPSSYTANRVFFTNSGGTAVTASDGLIFNGTNLGIGTTTPGSMLTVGGNILGSGVLTLLGAASSTVSGKLVVAPAGNSWPTASAGGANWGTRDSWLYGVSDEGLIGIAGFSRTSDQTGAATESIGAAGFVIGDTANRNVWGLYSDVQFELGNYGYGLEIAVKNKRGIDITSTPYFAATGTYGIWLPAGGDDSYGGSPTNPNNTAIAIGSNSSTWNKGIVFFREGLTGSDGITGNATAIEMARGHGLVWRSPGNYAGAAIRSLVDTSGSDVGVLFINDGVTIQGASGSTLAQFAHQSSGVNHLQFINRATGAAPAILAQGSDAVVGMELRSKATGTLDLITDGTIRLRVGGEGNIGIGTSSPSARLTVSGDMRLTGRFADSSSSTGAVGSVLTATVGGTQWLSTSTLGLLSAASIDTSSELAAILGDETGTAGSVVFSASPTLTGTTTMQNLVATGGVILGDASIDRVEINSNILEFRGMPGADTAGTFRFGRTGGTGRFHEIIAFNSATRASNYLDFALHNGTLDATSSVMRLLGSGNVGIGTTSPSATLTIAGDMRLTGRFADSASSTGALGSVLTATANGTQWLSTSTLGLLSSASIDTSLELANILGDETGTGSAVFATSPTFSTQITTPIFIATSTTGTSTIAGGLAIEGSGFVYDYVTNRVGVGTANPLALLQVADTSEGNWRFSDNNLEQYYRNESNYRLRLSQTAYSNIAASSVAGIEFLSAGAGQGNGVAVGLADVRTLGFSTGNGASQVIRVVIDGVGNMGIGTTSPSARLTVAGDMRLTGRFADSSSSTGAVGSVLTATANGTAWVATSSLGIGGSGGGTVYLATTSTWTTGNLARVASNGTVDSVATSSLGLYGVAANSITSAQLAGSLSDETGTGNVVFSANPTFTGTATFASLFGTNATFTNATTTNLVATNATTTRLAVGTDSITDLTGIGLTVTGNALTVSTSTLGLNVGFFAQGGNSYGAAALLGTNDNNVLQFETNGTVNMTLATSGNLGIGTTTPSARLSLERTGISGTTTALIDQYLGLANSVNGAQQFGNAFNIVTTNTATTTIVGSLMRITDSTAYANTVRGLEVQTNRGTNTLGENTAISGFGRTFGVRGTTEGDAGSVLEPAGIYGVTRGTTQGNAIRGYSGSITTAPLMSLYQDTSAFAGIGLLMNFGNTTGSFSSSTSKFLDLQVAGVSRFVVNASGTLTIGDGVNDAGLIVRGSATTTNLRVTGAFRDSANSAGTLGQVLQSTGTSTRWVATSTLGISGGAGGSGAVYLASTSPWTTGFLARVASNGTVDSIATSALGLGNGTFLGLSDSDQSSFTANRLIFTNSGGTGLTDSANLVFTGTNFGIGSTSPTARFTVVGQDGTSTIAVFGNDNINVQTRIIGDNGSNHSALVSGAYNFGYGFDYSGNPFIGDTSDTTGGIFLNRTTGLVGVGTTTPWARLTVDGGMYGEVLTLGSLNDTDFITPVGAAVKTKINIPYYNPGAFNQLIALGLPSTANISSRAISIFDARTTAHQPTLGVFSPDENSLVGLSWDGSNSTSYLKTWGTNNIGIRSSSTDIATFLAGGNVGIGTTSPTARLTVDASAVSGYAVEAVSTSTGGGGYSYNTGGNGSNVAFNARVGGAAFSIYKTNGTTEWNISNGSQTNGSILNLSSGWGTGSGHIYFRNGLATNSNIALAIVSDNIATQSPTSKIGIGTTSPSATLTVSGDLRVTGRFADSSSSTGTVGSVLTATANGTAWVATSSLGLGGGGSSFSDSAGLAALLGDETGTGNVVFSANPTFTGTATFANLFGTNATFTNATTTRFTVGTDSITDITGTGLAVVNNNLTVSTSTLGLASGFFAQGGNSFGTAAVLGTNDNNLLQFETNGVVNMTLATSGNLGIGTTTPRAKLALDGRYTVTGSELVTNGTFTGSASGWTLEDCATYGSNQVTVTFTACTNALISTDISVTTGSVYLLTFDIVSASNEEVYVDADNASINSESYGPGSYSILFVAGNTGTETLYFESNSYVDDGSWTIDNVSVKEVNAPTALAVTGYDGSTWLSVGDVRSVNSILLGQQALSKNTSGYSNTAIGTYALRENTSGRDNTALGTNALLSNVAGFQNTAVGNNALKFNNGLGNTGLGHETLSANTTGIDNTGLGQFALSAMSGGDRNIAAGTFAGYGAQGSYNSLIGAYAAFSLLGENNAALGAYALHTSKGTGTVAVGYAAGYGSGGASSYNTLIGYESGFSIDTGSENTLLGRGAGYLLTTGSNNIFLGASSSANVTTGSSNIALGFNINLASSTGSNQLNIGNLLFGTGVDGTGTTLSSGNIGIGTSSPSQKLTVIGNIYATSSIFSGNGSAATVAFGSGLDTNTGLYFSGSDDIFFVTDGSDRGTVDNNGLFNWFGSIRGAYLASGDGNAGLPGFNFTEDSDTGMFRAATNTIAFSTAGTERLTITASGSVGIGTTSPVARLSVDTSSLGSTPALMIASSSGRVSLMVANNGFVGLGTKNPQNPFHFVDSGYTTHALFESVTDNSSLEIKSPFGYASFITYKSNGNAAGIFGIRGSGNNPEVSPTGFHFIGSDNINNEPIMALSVLSTNLGLGTTTPQNRITVIGYNNYPLLDLASSTGQSLVRVTALGNLGLGTSSPSARLTVAGDMRLTGRFADSSSSTGAVGSVLTATANGTQWLSTSTLGLLSAAAIDTSLELANILDDEIGSGSVVFSANPTFTGVATFASLFGTNATFTNATVTNLVATNATTSRLAVGSDAVTDLTGTGLTITGNALTVATSSLGLNVGFFAQSGNSFGVPAVLGTNDSNILQFETNNVVAMTVATSGSVGIGSTTPGARLTLRTEGSTGTTTEAIGIDQYMGLANVSAGAVQIGNRFSLVTTNTATTTIVGSIFRITDSTTYGNTVRGLEVQAQRGTNTLGENTAISGFARTFGVRGTTEGDAGAVVEPAGLFGETKGTAQGNAIRGYSSTITTASLLSLFQDSSTFTGTGLQMNFGNSGGSFSSTSSRFLDFKVAGTSRFTVNASGTVTIGDGTNRASLQIGRGGICVDDDGSCNASTSGLISADTYFTGNSDLAENYFSADGLKAGEIVALDGGLSVARASVTNREAVIGVVSTAPGLTLGADDSSLRAGERPYPIALAGRVPIRLSNENGPIKKGDQIMLSSIPGVGMRASSSGIIIGVALEDFDESLAYSNTFISQFGENLIVPEYPPFVPNDPRINDGCYFGGGEAAGEAPCVPLKATTTDDRVREAEVLAATEAKQRALRQLARTPSERVTLSTGEVVKVGQITMFVQREYRYLDDAQLAQMTALSSTSTDAYVPANEENPTLFDRMAMLASSFMDGVLDIFKIKTQEVETEKLCIGSTCVDEATLKALLEAQTQNQNPAPAPAAPPTPEEAPEPLEPPAEETDTSGADGGENEETPIESTEPVAEEPAQPPEETPSEPVVDETSPPETEPVIAPTP